MNFIETLLAQHAPMAWNLSLWGSLENLQIQAWIRKKIEGEKEVILLNFVDIMRNHYIDEKIPTMIVTASDAKIQKCTCERGDIFITPSSETKDEIGFAAVITKTLSNTQLPYNAF